MSLLDKIKDEVAADIGHEDWNTLAQCETMSTQIYVYEKQVAPLYATAVAQDALNRAAEELPDDKLEYVDYHDFSCGVQSVSAEYKQDVLNTPINLL